MHDPPPSVHVYGRRARRTYGETTAYPQPRCQVAGRKPPADATVDSARRVLSYLLLSSLTRYYRRIALSSVKCFYVSLNPPSPPSAHHRYSCTRGMNRVRHTGTHTASCVCQTGTANSQAKRNQSPSESIDDKDDYYCAGRAHDRIKRTTSPSLRGARMIFAETLT